MNRTNLWKAAALTASMLAGSVNAATIDTFDSGDAAVVSGVLPGPITTPSVHAIGGSRTLMILDGGPVATSLVVVGGGLHHGQSSVSGGSSMVIWDAGGAGLGGIDLTDGGADSGIELALLAADDGIVDLSISLEDTGGMTSSLTLSGLVAGPHGFLFADFTGSAVITDIDAIFLTIFAGVSTDLTLDSVHTADLQVVPIPAAAWLFGSALLGLITVARRKQLKA